MVTLRRVTVAEGKARGTEIIEVKTAGGLEPDILSDAEKAMRVFAGL